MKLSKLHINPKNPRIIKDAKFRLLVENIKAFPLMLKYRPIIYDEDGMILGGDKRFKALIELKYNEVPDEWVRCVDDLTEEEKRKFIILDNAHFGEWDNFLLEQLYSKEELEENNIEIVHSQLEREKSLNERGEAEQGKMKYPIVIILTEKQYEKWLEMKEQIDEYDNNEAFFKLVKLNKKQP